MNKGYLKRQSLRLLMLVGITLALGQALQAMGFIGIKQFTWPGLAFAVLGAAIALACFAGLRAAYGEEVSSGPCGSRKPPR